MGPIMPDGIGAIAMAPADNQCCALTSSGQRPSLRHPAGWAPAHKGPPFPAWALASTRAHTLCGSGRLGRRRRGGLGVLRVWGRRRPFCALPAPPRARSRAPWVKRLRRAGRVGAAPPPPLRGPGPAPSALGPFWGPRRGRAALAAPPLAPVLCPRPFSAGRPWGPPPRLFGPWACSRPPSV